MSRRVLITGSSGFIGGQVTARALAEPTVDIRLVRHRSTPPVTVSDAGRARVEIARADMSDPATVEGLCRGVDAVVHCASLIEGDEEELRRTNDLGTAALVAEAARSGVRRFVYVSTAAVHGRGPFDRAEPGAPPVRPASATSRSRAAAERHVLAASGTVLRPHLVYGAGDRWVVPGLVHLIRRLGGIVDCPSVHSAVEVGALARAAWAAALFEGDLAGAHHVSHPDPLPVSALMELIREETGGAAGPALTLERARELVADEPLLRHHLEMLAVDHWFDSDPIWELPDLDPGPAPLDGLRQVMPYYRSLLG
ncbi:NAD-dependent epimerase/dehydratase family protein [Streptomyces sp. NPDC048664]|uniref:NAD-dependent epimerase/dehydratase family protein n=1 Tax=Streptomyces sp. NPDC048664 TaxID=3154505 RepID=UPI003446B9EE